MCIPQSRLLRHVPGPQTPPQRHVHPPGPPTATCTRPADPAPATCASPRTTYCDMYPARRPRLSDMCIPQDHLLRHVPGPQTPPQRHVTPAEPPTATCTRPADPASATCASPRTTYCDMYPARRPRLSDMCIPQNHLLRHVPGPQTPPQRHVTPAGPATATCDPSADTASATCAPAGPATATCDPPTDAATATCKRAAAERRSPTGIAAAGRETPAPSRKPETKTTKRRTRPVVAAPFPLARAPSGGRKPWSFARCAGDAGRRPALHCRPRFGRIAFSRQLACRARRGPTRWNGYEHTIASSDITRKTRPLRHVPVALRAGGGVKRGGVATCAAWSAARAG